MVKTKDFDIEEIKKLSPQERLARLKELDEKRKKEKEESEKLIQESIEEIKQQEQIEEELEHVDIPKAKKVDVDKLFEDESLEETVGKEKVNPEQVLQQQYHINIHELTSDRTYDNLTRWAEQAQQGQLSDQYREAVDELYGETAAAIEAFEQAPQYKSGSEETWDRLLAQRDVLRGIRKYVQ